MLRRGQWKEDEKVKIRTRLAVAFIIITVFPMLMIYLSVIALSDYQEKSFKEAYGLSRLNC